jgi:serine/threonine protein kinase
VIDSEAIAPEIQQEVTILSRLRHPHIAQYYGSTIEDGCLYIFLELVKMGSLQSLLKKFQVFDEGIISTYTRQILKGLEYLHNKNTIHRCKSPHLFSQ